MLYCNLQIINILGRVFMRSILWNRRMIFLLGILMILGFGKTIMVEAAETPKDELTLTEEFLTGTWVCSEGFVCSYEKGFFVGPTGTTFMNCKVEKGAIVGESYREEGISTKITIKDQDTIQIADFTAVRAESELGKKYQEKQSKLLIGKWLNYDDDREKYIEFRTDNNVITSSDVEEKLRYEYSSGKLKVYNPEKDDDMNDVLFLRINEEELSFFIYGMELKFYREGSKASIESRSGKADVVGDWVIASNDEKPISQWKFDSSDSLTIDYFGNEKDTKQTYTALRQNRSIVVQVEGKTYNLRKVASFDAVTAYYVSGDLEGILVPKDSKEGKYCLQKAKTIYKDGKVVQRNQYKKFSDELHPEITAISVSLKCKNNIWLDDAIKIDEYTQPVDQIPGICGQSYKVICNTTLKDAKITFTYNQSQLPYAYEKDLVIVRMDEKTGKKTVLTTTRNKKANKVAAKITKGGIYFLVDSYVYKGGIRDITKRNPKSTEWARLNDTGDILSLVDLKYIKKSQGNFSVSTVSQLASVVYYVNTTPDAEVWVFINNDLDLSGYKWAPMGWEGPNGLKYGFKGLINGWDHKISNLNIDLKDENVGLIGLADIVGVYNLKITNANISGSYNVGIITGSSRLGSYDNCYVDGVVNGYWAGSMIGNDSISEFRDCTADATVNGKKYSYLTSNEKYPCKIKVKEKLKITMDDNFVVKRPKATGYDNLYWSIYVNGLPVKDIDAMDKDRIKYIMNEPGHYRIFLCTFKDGQYVRVSNEIKRIIKK